VSDLKISELPQLAGANLAANDLLAVADTSASETRSITISDGIGKAVTLIADDTIPSAKILFAAGSVPGSAIEGETVNTSQLANDAVSAAKLANNSVTRLVSTLPATGDFTGQFALDTDDLKLYCWDGSTWQAIKAGGSVNTVIGGSAGVVNITVTQTGDSVTLNTTLDNTGAASQFLAGPTSGAGSVTYRVIAPADLPTATTTDKGAVLVNGNGLAMSGNQIVIDNTVTQNTSAYHVVRYNAKGLITDGRALIGADVPVATSGTVGVVAPGAGLGVNAAGTISHTNTVTPGTYEKVTVDAEGHVTAGGNLVSADLTDIEFSASQLTSGTINAARFAANSIEGTKLSNNAVTKIGGAGSTSGVVVFPTPDYNGQYFYDSLNGDLYLYDGNTWQPITITAGEIIFAGTFSANPTYNSGAGKIVTLTSAGTALGLSVNSALPAASGSNSRYYFVVSEGGTPTTGNAPLVALAPPDIVLSDGTAWTHVDVSSTVAAQTASNITTTAISGLTGSNVQDMLSSLNNVKANKAGDTFTGNVTLNNVSLVFDTSGSFNTTLTSAANNGANRTITIPAEAGTMLVSGNASIVNADINASAAIAYSKLAALTSGNILVGNASNVATSVAMSGDVTINNAGVTAIGSGVIVNADVNASAAIAFSKLASLTSGNILVGNGSNVATSVAMSGDITISNAGVTAIGSGVIVNADINASAEIAVSKLANGTARQLLQTNAAGTDVEWTSNVDIPGTLDVTGAAVFDSTITVSGSATASNFNANGSTVPANGMYFSTSSLRFATNSTQSLSIDASGTLFVGQSGTNDSQIVIGARATGNRAAYLDIVGDTTYTDYGVRIIRGNSGANAESAMLHRGTGDFVIKTEEAAPILFLTSATDAARILSNGKFLIGYTSDVGGAYKLQVNSQIFATSSTIATSDGRYKENVTPLGGCLDIVKALRPVSFTWKPQQDIYGPDETGKNRLLREKHNFPAGTQVGFVAQEVQTVLENKPWLGSIIKENKRAAVLDEKGKELVPEEQFYGIAEGNLIAVLTSALQEAVKRIENLESKLANL
jgi:hypothetical protein